MAGSHFAKKKLTNLISFFHDRFHNPKPGKRLIQRPYPFGGTNFLNGTRGCGRSKTAAVGNRPGFPKVPTETLQQNNHPHPSYQRIVRSDTQGYDIPYRVI